MWSPKSNENLSAWFYAIKMDGAFARWQDGKLHTKSGRVLQAPDRITCQLPRGVTLDGEIYAGVGQRQKVRKALSDQWSPSVKFVVFDWVAVQKPFEARYRRLEALHQQCGFDMIRQHRVTSEVEFQQVLNDLSDTREEGLVLRHPLSFYKAGQRSRDTLKWKPQRTGRGVIEHVTPKKKGVRVTLKECGGERATFTAYIAGKKDHENLKPGKNVDFTYHGRDEQGKPESAKIKLFNT